MVIDTALAHSLIYSRYGDAYPKVFKVIDDLVTFYQVMQDIGDPKLRADFYFEQKRLFRTRIQRMNKAGIFLMMRYLNCLEHEPRLTLTDFVEYCLEL